MPPQETDPGFPVSVQKSQAGWWWPAVGLGALGVVLHGPFEEGQHYLHYLHHSLASGQTRQEHSPTHQQKIGLKVY